MKDKKAFVILVLSLALALILATAGGYLDSYQEGQKAIKTLKCQTEAKSYAELRLREAEHRIVVLEKALNTDPDVLRRIFHLQGFKSFTIQNRLDIGSTAYPCSIHFGDSATGQRMEVNGSGYSAEESMSIALSRITRLRKELCEMLEEKP